MPEHVQGSSYSPGSMSMHGRPGDHSVTDKALDYGEQAMERTGEAARAVSETVKDHPFATLAIAAGLAFAVGALWKMGGSRQESRYEGLRARLSDIQGHLPRRWR